MKTATHKSMTASYSKVSKSGVGSSASRESSINESNPAGMEIGYDLEADRQRFYDQPFGDRRDPETLFWKDPEENSAT
ncbi:MAG: hypothetical protein U0892_08305 [Pirellulales bacterium]